MEDMKTIEMTVIKWKKSICKHCIPWTALFHHALSIMMAWPSETRSQNEVFFLGSLSQVFGQNFVKLMIQKKLVSKKLDCCYD
jgi:hypothetical protein